MAIKVLPAVSDTVDETMRGIFAAVLKIDGASLEASTHLTEDLAVDSLDALELALKIQDGFEIELDEKDFTKFTSYGEVIACVRALLACKTEPDQEIC